MNNVVAIFCILLSLILSGCLHSVRLPDAADGEAIRTGEKAIVLFRHQSLYDSNPRETLGTYPMEGFGFEMGFLDEDDKPLTPVISLSSPSEQARPVSAGFELYPMGVVATAGREITLPAWGTKALADAASTHGFYRAD